jgi:phospholipase C
LGIITRSAVLAVLATLLLASGAARADFPAQADDTFVSVGSFRLYVAPTFRALMTGCPGYNPATFRLQTADLSDPATVVGRSNAITEGSAQDASGLVVGTAGTLVKDADIAVSAEATPGTRRELHTELRHLDLQSSGTYLRSGTAAPSRPVSPGESESLDPTGTAANDLPASSLFDVFAELHIPQCGAATTDVVLNNPWALLLQTASVAGLPPRAIYVQGNITAVLVRFTNANPGQWRAGDVFGWLVQMGEGAGYDINNASDVSAFDAAMAAQGELPLPPNTCMVDLGGTFKVGLGDLLQFAQAYNSTTAVLHWNAAADFDGSGKIGLADLLMFASRYNQVCTQFQLPIDHIVVLMQENRSFDTYLGHLKAYDSTLDVESEPPTASNPDPTNPSGPAITAFHQTNLCEVADLSHSWNNVHAEWDNGAMDGFTASNAVPADPTGSRTMGYYTQNELPFYYELFRTFAMGDRYFSSVLGPTFPNRFSFLAGTSFGHIANDIPTNTGQFSQPAIFNSLDAAGVTWKIYVSSSTLIFGDEFAYVRGHSGNIAPVSTYFSDAQAGTLPQVAFIEPLFQGAKNVENDEHPPSNVQVGEKFSADVIDALFASPEWSSSALFQTYDEHGGYYDHVPPPAAPVPDGIAPMLQPGDTVAGFDRYGVRVPVIVVSPYSRNHFVSHVVHDHTSILRFIEMRFGLPALTNRDASSDPMFEFFSFQSPPFLTPPTLPAAPVDLTQPACTG